MQIWLVLTAFISFDDGVDDGLVYGSRQDDSCYRSHWGIFADRREPAHTHCTALMMNHKSHTHNKPVVLLGHTANMHHCFRTLLGM